MSETQPQRPAEARGKVRDNGVSRSSEVRLDISCLPPAHGAPAPKRSSSLPPAGRPVSKARAVVAHHKKVKLPDDMAIDAEVDLHADKGEHFLSTCLNISISGVERRITQGLADLPKGICPYSKATGGNIAVT